LGAGFGYHPRPGRGGIAGGPNEEATMLDRTVHSAIGTRQQGERARDGRAWGGRWARGLALGLVVLAGSASAWADEFIDKANALYKTIQADRRSDTVLLPLLVKTAPAPESVRRPMSAALLPADRPAFKDALAWARAEPQKAVLDALKKVTSESDWKKVFGFAQPYGFEGVDPDLVIAQAYTDLGDPPSLSSARVGYMPLLDRLASLAQVEATALLSEGKGKDALDLMERWVFFARQMCERQLLSEKVWAYKAMAMGLSRMRDLAFVDSRSETPSINADHLREMINKLKDKGGVIGTDRLELPMADRLGVEQALARLFTKGGGPNVEAFSAAMGRARSVERPLRLFSESAKWDVLSKMHADEPATRAQLEALFRDWSRRWSLSPFDRSLRIPSEYARMDKVKFAALDALLGDIGQLFDLRTLVQAEVVGTRMGLAVAGFKAANKVFPPGLSSARPALVSSIDPDPFEKSGKPPEMFIPGKRPSDKSNTQEILVFPGDGQPNFSATVSDDTFVLYLVGPDGNPAAVRRATQMTEDERGDYLVWPPVLSLLRKHLIETSAIP
jgi:hypothetical protein